MTEPTLEQLAMEYAIVSTGIDPDRGEGAFDLKPQPIPDELKARDLRPTLGQRAKLVQLNYHLYERIVGRIGLENATTRIDQARDILKLMAPA